MSSHDLIRFSLFFPLVCVCIFAGVNLVLSNLRSCQRRFPSIQEKFEEHDEVKTMGVAVLCLVF